MPFVKNQQLIVDTMSDSSVSSDNVEDNVVINKCKQKETTSEDRKRIITFLSNRRAEGQEGLQ